MEAFPWQLFACSVWSFSVSSCLCSGCAVLQAHSSQGADGTDSAPAPAATGSDDASEQHKASSSYPFSSSDPSRQTERASSDGSCLTAGGDQVVPAECAGGPECSGQSSGGSCSTVAGTGSRGGSGAGASSGGSAAGSGSGGSQSRIVAGSTEPYTLDPNMRVGIINNDEYGSAHYGPGG